MGYAYMPLFTGDLERDTADLSPTEFGIYVRLLMHAWNNHGKIPLDTERLCNITRCKTRVWWRFGQPIIERFWKPDAGRTAAQNMRLSTELLRLAEKANENKRTRDHTGRFVASPTRTIKKERYSEPREQAEPRGDLLYSEPRAKPLPVASAELNAIIRNWSKFTNGAG